LLPEKAFGRLSARMDGVKEMGFASCGFVSLLRFGKLLLGVPVNSYVDEGKI